MERPEIVEDEHLEYLDMLRKSGITNMFASCDYIQRVFDMNRHEAKEVLSYWVHSFKEQHTQGD